MTAEELFAWADENIHQNDWRSPMVLKMNEEKIKSLTEEQISGMEILISLTGKAFKFYQGYGPVVRLEDLNKTLTTIKKIRGGDHATK